MTPDDFRKHGHRVVDWIADYYERLEQYPVLSQVAPGSVRAALPAAPPEQGEGFDAVLRDLDDVIMPGESGPVVALAPKPPPPLVTSIWCMTIAA